MHAPLPPTVRRRALSECHSNNRVCLVRFHGCVCQHTSPDGVVPTFLRSFQQSTDKNRYCAGRVGMRTRNVCTVFLSNFVYHFFEQTFTESTMSDTRTTCRTTVRFHHKFAHVCEGSPDQQECGPALPAHAVSPPPEEQRAPRCETTRKCWSCPHPQGSQETPPHISPTRGSQNTEKIPLSHTSCAFRAHSSIGLSHATPTCCCCCCCCCTPFVAPAINSSSLSSICWYLARG